MLCYQIEFKGKQRQDCDMFEYNVKNDSKVQKELQVLSKAGDRTINFIKNKAKKEVSEEAGDIDVNVFNAKETKIQEEKKTPDETVFSTNKERWAKPRS